MATNSVGADGGNIDSFVVFLEVRNVMCWQMSISDASSRQWPLQHFVALISPGHCDAAANLPDSRVLVEKWFCCWCMQTIRVHSEKIIHPKRSWSRLWNHCSLNHCTVCVWLPYFAARRTIMAPRMLASWHLCCYASSAVSQKPVESVDNGNFHDVHILANVARDSSFQRCACLGIERLCLQQNWDAAAQYEVL
jgi:hypothetical protein